MWKIYQSKNKKPLPSLTRVSVFGGPTRTWTWDQRIPVCVTFTTPWTMPSPYSLQNLGGCRLVSTRSKCFHTKLRSASPYALLHLDFTEFDTIPYTVSSCKAQLALWVLCSNQLSYRPEKLILVAQSPINLLDRKLCHRRSAVEAIFRTFDACNLLIYIGFL